MDKTTLIYNAKDATITKDIEEQIWPELEANGYLDTYNMTARCLPPFIYMMTRGVKVNVDAITEAKKDLEARIITLQAELDEKAGQHLNASSPKQCQEYFYIKKNIKPFTKLNAKGESVITTDDKAMQRLAVGSETRPAIPEAKLVQEIRKCQKFLGTYLEIEFDEDGRFRCSINPRGAVSGRISTSKTIFGTGMNMQNLPPEFKAFLVADDGFIILDPDLKGAEWFIVAYLTGDANMIKVAEEGLDPHIHTAFLMFKQPKDLIEYENKLIGHSTDPFEIAKIREKLPQLRSSSLIPRNMSMRQAAKKANHGLNYDEGYNTFAMTNEMTQADAKKIIALYHEAYPGIRIWYEKVKNQLREDRILMNCFGRKRKFLMPMGDKLYKSAYAHVPQSTASDNLNIGMCGIYEDQSDLMKDVQLLLQIHDSMPNQYPDHDVRKLAQVIQKEIEYLTIDMEYGGRSFHLKVDMKAGYNLGESGMTELKHTDDLDKLTEELEKIINVQRAN